jgi:glycosyltransferase involved in cell wall biosynthesis
MRQSFPFLYLTDDGGPDYLHRAYRLGVDLVRREGISTIFSSFRPWSDHLVARRLKRKFPHLHWIADFRDLHADPVRQDVWWPALQRRWARWVVKPADEVWGVSEGQVEYLKEIFPAASVHRNHLVALPPVETAPETRRFTIVYTGSLYEKLQSIRPLVDSLNRLVAAGKVDPDKIELIYRGKDEVLWTEWITDLNTAIHCNIRAYIAPATAQKLQQEAQLLLLLNWSARNYYGVLTAKLYDYLAAGRPILALVNGPGDRELQRMVEGCHAGRIFGNDQTPDQWLLGCYQSWLGADGVLPWSSDRKRLANYLEDIQDDPIGISFRD